jgi:protein-tyrosine-phosphatase
MAEKGIDLSRQYAKPIEKVPHLEYYNVVIALAKKAQKLYAAVPRKAIKLDWALADPSQAQGTPEEIKVAYEAAFLWLQDHIKDLAEAIIGNGEK